MFADLITATILNSTCFFTVSNKHFKYIIYIWQDLGQITFCNYIVTTISFFVITIHYVNIVLTPTVGGDGPRLVGRDWLGRVTLDWKTIGLIKLDSGLM